MHILQILFLTYVTCLFFAHLSDALSNLASTVHRHREKRDFPPELLEKIKNIKKVVKPTQLKDPEVTKIKTLMKKTIKKKVVKPSPVEDPEVMKIKTLMKKTIKKKVVKPSHVEDPEVMKIKNMCKSMNCQKQTDAAKNSRKGVVKMITDQKISRAFDGSEDDAKSQAEQQVAATQRVKMAVIKSMGLGDTVIPSDDGLWDRDIILTKQQADAIVESIKKDEEEESGSATDVVRQSIVRSRKRRNAYFLESFPSYKWDIPIPYKIADRPPHFVFSTAQKKGIADAIKDIESKTCLWFVKSKADSAVTFGLSYLDPSICGSSNIGRQSYNDITLNSECPKNFTGVVVHEIMHVLGFGHTHNRVDRDDFIDIKTENMNPQQTDVLKKEDKRSFTSYGVPYDYHSILHYDPQNLSVNKKDVFIARKKPQEYFQFAMGRRTGGLSSLDSELIRKAYCQPSCKDDHVWCGWWAYQGYCDEAKGFFDLMRTTCKKSCDLC